MRAVKDEGLRVRVRMGVCLTPGAPSEPVYGLVAERGDCRWEWPDVDTDRARVEELAHKLEAEQPAACHLEDIVRDFVLERYLPEE